MHFDLCERLQADFSWQKGVSWPGKIEYIQFSDNFVICSKKIETQNANHISWLSLQKPKRKKIWSVLVLYEIVRVDPIYGPAWIMTSQPRRRLHLSFGKITIWISITCYHLRCTTFEYQQLVIIFHVQLLEYQ